MTVLNVTGKMFIDHRTREWCKLPYPGHPNGCPNYDTGRKTCPPDAPLIEDWLDFTQPHYFIVEEFNLGEWARKMKTKHPNWTEKQCRCCLYWQGKVRKLLRSRCEMFIKENPGMMNVHICPEAMGVNVIKTARHLGLPISTKPREIVYKIALVGYRKCPSCGGKMNMCESKFLGDSADISVCMDEFCEYSEVT